jgi:selenium donor protein
LDEQSIPDGLMGFSTHDDCAIYPLPDGSKLIQTVDFFTPIVDDPFEFGRIAASNSLSDIYAMGGKPLFALNIACFPSDELPLEILTEILNGGIATAKEAGIPILGGHTVKDKEPKYGLVVTGIVENGKAIKNSTSKPGDVLILTKPIGTGIISTAIKKDKAPNEMIQNAIEVMVELNSCASKSMEGILISACTDVTGFGLLGHLSEMCRNSNVSATLEFNSVPFIEGVFELAQNGIIPGGTNKNLNFVQNDIDFSDVLVDYQKLMLADAQTSGGLLISVPLKHSQELISNLKDNNASSSAIIGQVYNPSEKLIYVN